MVNNNFGFYISKLHVTGLNVKSAELSFDKGANLISGLSDTGKSYIFACINFMLGGGDIPKDIPESVGYTDVFLEIKTYKDKVFTLRRKLSGGKFKLKEVPLEVSLTKGIEKELYHQHSGTNRDNISSFLLNLCGFEDKYVRLNKQNAKKELSFRDISRLTLIDEERIITEKSPVYSGQYTDQTKEQSVIDILLTGNDAKDLEQIEDVKIYSSRIRGKIEFVETIIKDLNIKLLSINENYPKEKQVRLQNKVDYLTSVLANSSIRLEKLSTTKQELFNEIKKLESKQILQDELSNRFYLLKEHYKSDISRLEFITEGEEFFSQLTAVNCPLCGGEMDKEHYDCIVEEGKKTSNIMNAILVELEKIRIKLSDLESTLEQLVIDKNERDVKLKSLNFELISVNVEIQKKLEPSQSSTKNEVNSLISELTLIKQQNVLEQQIQNYHEQRNLLNIELKRKPKIGEPIDDIKYTVLQSLCDTIEEILSSWKYPNITNVNFDASYKIYDIVINNKNRKAHGKGIRAITYTSFVLGLMEYCIKRNLPHSRNVILDSPLTTYQGKEIKTESEEITKDMEDSFFSEFANIDEQRQIIILDNKDPNDSIQSKINYIHFTGDKNIGRQGFFPI